MDLQPEQLYVFHFILYDEFDHFANPILIGKFYPRYGHSLPSQSELSKTDIIIIGVSCGGLILVIAMIVLGIAVCKKRKKLAAYGMTSYGDGKKLVNVPKTTVKSAGYSDEVIRSNYFKVEDVDDEDPLVQDSASGLDSEDKSPPPAYNAVHYNARPAPVESKNKGSFSDTSPSYTTFDHPPYRPTKGGAAPPLLPPVKHESDEEIRKRLSSDEEEEEDVPEPPRVPPSDESDMNNRYPSTAFGDRSHGGRQSPNGSSVASSKPYRSDNEYIDEADEDYSGFLV